MMKKVLFLLLLVEIFGTAYADSWSWPQEKDYYCENKRFVAHVTPPKYPEKTGSLLEVFEVQKDQRTSLWRCKPGNKVAPVEVYISNNGRYVVTNNEWHRVGYGDFVVAFYGKNGLIKNYSMEEVLHLSGDNSKFELFRLIPHSASSRWWDEDAIKFFDTYNDKLYYCIWLHLFDRWVAWNPANGKEIPVEKGMTEAWNSKARSWAIKQIQGKTPGEKPYEFLGNLKYPDDRRYVERLLSSKQFRRTSYSTQEKHLLRYTAGCSERLLAERILARWDGRTTKKRAPSTMPLHYLGKLEGTVTLPVTDNPRDATLWIYLIPDNIPEDQWHKQPPVQRLVASFADYSFKRFDLEYTRKFPFCITTITPGRYRVKVFLDKTKPLSKYTDEIFLPRQGDYQSDESPIISIEAGESANGMKIDCTRKVIDGTD